MEEKVSAGRGGRIRGYLSRRVIGRTLPGIVWSAIRTGVGSPREWTSVLLVFLTLSVATWSIEQAHWIRPQPSLITTLVLAVLAGLLLVRSRLSARIAYPLMVVLGLGVTVWQTVGLMPFSETESALHVWWVSVSGVQPSEGTTYFAMFLSLVIWVIGFISTWYILRRQNVWVTVGLGTLAVLVNLSNLPREDYLFLPVYMLVAMLLIGQVNLARQGVWFGQRTNSFPYRGVVYLVGAVVCISMLTVATAWFVPQPPVDQIGLGSVSGSLTEEGARRQWFNIFAGVNSKWSLIDSSEQQTLSFNDPLSTIGRVHFIVTADRPAYWRTRRYDTYHPWGWTSSEISDREITAYEDAVEARPISIGEELTYKVENKLKTDVVLVKGELLSSDMPVILQTFTEEKPGRNLTVVFSGQTGENEEGLSEPGDVIAVVTPRLMKPYQRYTAVTSVASYTPDELSLAGEDYPEEVTGRYLQLPDDLPVRVSELAEDIIREAESQYDKVVAVKAYINSLEYNVEADIPPEDADAVDYFLFESREGVCTSFASSMAVMLRCVGVPTRLNTGYLEGDYDEETESYLLRVRHYHARTEVYFSGLGWVEFSATPVGGSTDAIVGVGDETDFMEIIDPTLMLMGEETFGPTGGDFTGRGTRRITLPGPQLYVYFIIIGVPVAVFFAVRGGYAFWLQRLKRINNPADAYRKMSRLAALGKIGPVLHETPLEYCARLALALPLQAEAIDAIAQAYVETRFSSRKELSRLQKGRLQKTWVELVPSLVRRMPRLRTRPG
jgi:transglutaminase-like putative cysteine protease